MWKVISGSKERQDKIDRAKALISLIEDESVRLALLIVIELIEESRRDLALR